VAQVADATHQVRNLRANLGKLERGLRRQLREIVVEILDEAFDKTQEIVPYKKGRLSRSGRTSVRVGAQQVSGKIIYGGPDAPHALRQHEGLELEHKNGRQAKYVESVVRQVDFPREIARRINLTQAVRG
jgi:hypothetical protein